MVVLFPIAMAQLRDAAVAVVCLLCGAASAVQTIDAASPLVYWSARTVPGAANGSVVADWVGTSVTVSVSNNFTFVSALIADGCSNGNKFTVRMRNSEGVRSLDVAEFYTRPGLVEYDLFASAGRLSFWGTTATFSLIKAVEARFTQCAAGANLTFIGFRTDGVFVPAVAPTRRIEVIGDSISAGDLVHCADVWGDHMTVNNSLWSDSWPVSYGSLLCETFGAACSTVAWGGMGLCAGDVASWTWPTLPDVYPSALAWPVSVAGQGAPLAYPWAFSAWVPQAVIINLGTNDAAGNRFSNATFAARFVETYIAFVLNISAGYGGEPDPALGPTFFLGWGPMSTAYETSVQQVIANLTSLHVPVFGLNFSCPAPGCGCGHPDVSDHSLMAHGARQTIAAAMHWQ